MILNMNVMSEEVSDTLKFQILSSLCSSTTMKKIMYFTRAWFSQDSSCSGTESQLSLAKKKRAKAHDLKQKPDKYAFPYNIKAVNIILFII